MAQGVPSSTHLDIQRVHFGCAPNQRSAGWRSGGFEYIDWRRDPDAPHAIRPPFEDYAQVVEKELLRLVDAGIDRFYVGHGGALNAREVLRHAETLFVMPSCTKKACDTLRVRLGSGSSA